MRRFRPRVAGLPDPRTGLVTAFRTSLGAGPASNCCAGPARANPNGPAAPTTTAPPSETKVASEAASQLVRTYYAVRDELRQQPKASLDKLTTVAISTELSAQQNLFKRERKDGLHQVGTTKIAKMTVQTVNLDNSNPKVGKVPTVQVDVCYDVSGADLVGDVFEPHAPATSTRHSSEIGSSGRRIGNLRGRSAL